MRLSLLSASLIVLAGVTAACGGPSETAKPAAPAAETPAATPEAAPAAAPEAAAETAPVTAPVETAAAPAEPSLEFASLPEPYNSADYARGRRTFKLCQSCHTTTEGAGALVGPNLYGLFGREAGKAPGFDYSDALKSADFTWTPDKVDHWLENPQTFLKGNRMTFAGVRNPEDRKAVIAFLMTETGYQPE